MIKYTPPKFVEPDKADEPPNLKNDSAVSDKSNQKGEVKKDLEKAPEDPPTPPVVGPTKPTEDPNKVYTTVEIQPEFAGWVAFLNKNFKYPADAQNDGKQGNVIINFIVEKDGSIQGLEVAPESPQKDKSLVDEAKRVISKTSGKWTPGVQNDTKVRTYHSQSINFVIPDEE